MDVITGPNILGVFALSSAISCHLLSRRHFGVTKSWIVNKWFWAGLFGNLPALVACCIGPNASHFTDNP